MFSRRRFVVALLLIPGALAGALGYLSSRKPQPLIGSVSSVGVSGVGQPFGSPFSNPGNFGSGFMPREGLPSPASAIAYSPDRQLVCSAAGLIFKWAPDKKKWRPFGQPDINQLIVPGATMGGQEPKSRLIFSPDGRRLLVPETGNATNTAVYDFKNRQPTGVLRSTGRAGVVFSDDGFWAAWSEMNVVALFDLRKIPLDKRVGLDWYERPGKRSASWFFVLSTNPTALAFSPDSRVLAVGFGGQIALFDVAAKLQKMRLQCDLQSGPVPVSGQYTGRGSGGGLPALPNSNPLRLEWSSDGGQLAALSATEIAIYDANLQKLAGAPLPAPSALASSVSPGGMPGSSGGFSAPRADFPDICWTPDSQSLFSTGDEVRRWRASDLKLQSSYGLNGPIAVSPDGNWLLTRNIPKAREPLGLLKWNIR